MRRDKSFDSFDVREQTFRAEFHVAIDMQPNGMNNVYEITGSMGQLFRACKRISRDRGIALDVPDAKAFGRRVTSIGPMLSELGWEIDPVLRGDGSRKKSKGNLIFQFRKAIEKEFDVEVE